MTVIVEGIDLASGAEITIIADISDESQRKEMAAQMKAPDFALYRVYEQIEEENS